MHKSMIVHNLAFRKRKKMRLLSSGAYFDAVGNQTHYASKLDFSRSSYWNMKNATSAQSRRIRQHKTWRVQVHADMLKIKQNATALALTDKAKYNGGTPPRQPEKRFGGVIKIPTIDIDPNSRGTIKGFSRASRKRMIEFMAKVRQPGAMLFLTMTYDDTSLQREDLDFKAEFEAFRRRFERAYPNWRALWRTELETRKSGALQGLDVPHYHMIVFTGMALDTVEHEAVAETFQGWGVPVWQEITSSHDENHLIYGYHVTPVRSRKHAYSYVSKYVGKCANDTHEIGRRWGRIGKFDTSESETFHLSDNEMIEFRRLIRKWLKGRNTRYSKRFARQSSHLGFTVFGLGDTGKSDDVISPFASCWQFIIAAQQTVAIKRAIERGYGD